MAHMMETMAYAGEVPWHGLGKKVLNDLTPEQMMKEAGVDWHVEELETFVEFNGDKIPTGKKALVRETDGRVLTEVGANWHPVQNIEAFEFFSEFVESGSMEMHTAGSLKNGEIVWVLAKVGEEFTLGNGDTTESYLLFSNPHQYGKTIQIKFTPIRVVCKNTISLALRNVSDVQISLNHRRQFDADAVKETLGIAHVKMEKYREMADYLSKSSYKADTLDEYLTELFGTKKGAEGDLTRTGETVRELVETSPGFEYSEGSWWNAFNAVTYYTDHLAGRSADTRLTSAWYGYNEKKKIQALEKALEYAEAA